MNTTQILILAVVQGITEFLPVSSSGHLVIVESLMRVTADVADVNIVLHAGTLGSIVVFYWHRIRRLLTVDRKVIGVLLVGTLPAVVAGLAIKKLAEGWLESPLVAGVMLPITGLMLLLISRRPEGKNTYLALTYQQALLIGVFQAFAITPGISRSGATIVAGLLVGLRRQDAATFSFLLAIPVIAGATLLECTDLLGEHALATRPANLLLGALVAFVVGLLALKWLLQWVEKGKLHYFAFWCIPLGILIVIWQLNGVLN